jgi:hypothetical protein
MCWRRRRRQPDLKPEFRKGEVERRGTEVNFFRGSEDQELPYVAASQSFYNLRSEQGLASCLTGGLPGFHTGSDTTWFLWI